MIKAAEIGNTRAIRKLVSRGLSPLMVEANEHSGLNEAIKSYHLGVVDCLLESREKEQFMLWNEDTWGPELPLHTAAMVGFMEVLNRVLKEYPDINVSIDGCSTARHLAAGGLPLGRRQVTALPKTKHECCQQGLRISLSYRRPSMFFSE